MENAIEIKNVGKKYNITHQRGSYVSLRDVITNILKNPFKHFKHKAKKVLGKIEKEEFWALKDINLTIKKGEIVGIIGANGAGKSTLLKLLSRITPPTTGEIKLHGRVASLLEVGTGFHPELTGRENIFLNGAILGMTKKEIVERFDDIVEFSGVKQFIDTPVKRYSSGMYVRLAFAVAAHMEPDILVVDEVLAVGDAEFQKKSLGKLDKVSKTEGRTILFVSHNMAAIQRLCSKTILLEDGKVKMFGETKDVVKKYLNSGIGLSSERKWKNLKLAPGDNVVKIKRVFLHEEGGKIINSFDVTKKIGITIEYEVFENGFNFTHGINVFNESGINIFDSHDIKENEEREIGEYSSTVWIPNNFLAEGVFLLE